MPAYVVVDIDIHDPQTYERYKPLAAAAVAAHGGEYVARGGATTVLEGEWRPRRLVILRFPSVEAARGWWEGEEYAEAKGLRQRAATSRMVIVEGIA